MRFLLVMRFQTRFDRFLIGGRMKRQRIDDGYDLNNIYIYGIFL